jgi:hypothetical protein
MKHLKLYEKKFNTNSLKKFAKEKDELYSLIKEYSILHELYFFEKDDTISDVYYEYNVNTIGDEAIIITVTNTTQLLEPYMISNVYDLHKYIENPKVYHISNKYNL